jgi:hypothetical protein
VEQEADPHQGSTPVWVVPPAASDAFVRTQPRGSVAPVSFDEVARRIVEIAGLDLEPSRPEEALPVSASVA